MSQPCKFCGSSVAGHDGLGVACCAHDGLGVACCARVAERISADVRRTSAGRMAHDGVEIARAAVERDNVARLAALDAAEVRS